MRRAIRRELPLRIDVTILTAACVWCVSIQNDAEGSTMNEIVILGAGYTGMAAAMGLAGRLRGRDDVHITLVNPQTRFIERLRLHQTASGQALADLQIPELSPAPASTSSRVG
jgi:hypothetical protein